MRKQIAIVILLLSLGFAAQAANFSVSLDRNTIRLGEEATLSLTFEGGQPSVVPEPNVAGLDFSNPVSTQNSSDINGVMSFTVTISYAVIPHQAGGFTIPPMTTQIGGQRFTSRAIHLTVLKNDAPNEQEINSGLEPAFMKLVMPSKQVYVGEAVTSELDIYLRDDVQNYGNLQFTSTPTEGFSLGKTAEGRRFRAQVGSRVYTVIPLSVGLTALKTGTLTVGPFTASVVVVLPESGQQNQDPFFRSFFNQGTQKQIALSTEALTVPSLPLPDPKPANFNGAIGTFTLNVSAGPTNLTVGDPLTVRIQISGKGTFDSISLPDQSGLRDFRIFPPTAKTELSDKLGFEGAKTFEEIVTPQNNDVHQWPEFSFSYFEPEDGQYHTLNQAAVPLTVRAAAAVPPPTLAGNKTTAPESQTSQDILPIKQNLGRLEAVIAPLVFQTKFIALQSVPVLAFLAAFIWRKRTDNLANNPRLRRQRAVAQLVRNSLTELRQFAAENKPDEFFALLFRIMQEQLGERLDCPATAITEAVVDDPRLGASPELKAALRELFQLCNQARYAPVRGVSELNSVAVRLEQSIKELQALKI